MCVAILQKVCVIFMGYKIRYFIVDKSEKLINVKCGFRMGKG